MSASRPELKPWIRTTLAGSLALVLTAGASSCHQDQAEEEQEQASLTTLGILPAEIVATGIPGASGLTQVGTFHRGGPIHDKAAFAASTAPGMVLAPDRLLVTSSSNFGAPLAVAGQPAGTVLSLDVSQGTVAVPSAFAAAGGQASALGGKVMVYDSQSPAFLNSVNNPAAATAALPAASLPLGISLNRGFGRPWITNAPLGATGAGTVTVDDPSGAPLAGAPSAIAGGVFSGIASNRPGALKGLETAVLATALLTKSPDGSGRAVFLAAEADGSIVQIHVAKGVSEFAPAGTFTPIPTVSPATVNSRARGTVTHVGLVFNWVPTRIAYVTDPLANRVLKIDIGDDGNVFTAGPATPFMTHWANIPVDIAPAVPEIASDNFASNTTLGGGSDLYVLNRGDNSIVRVGQDGGVRAVRYLVASGPAFTVAGLTVSEDAQTLWVSATTAAGGIVLRVPAFGAGLVTPGLVYQAHADGAVDPVAMGANMFAREISPFQGLGPLFNGKSCIACHNSPVPGGMGTTADTFVTRVGVLSGGTFDPLLGGGGPVARAHSITELGFSCGLPVGIPAAANVMSRRSAMTVRGTGLIDFVQERDVLAVQTAQSVDIRGKVSRLDDGRMGRFGWKANIGTLVEFMGDAFRTEMGLTSPLVPEDLVSGCGSNWVKPELDGVPLQVLTAYLETLDPPVPASTCLTSAGAATFAASGCAGCHTPSYAGPGRTINLYSDLLLHDMGPALDDHVQTGSALGNEWRTMPLWKVSERSHYLHDGRATTLTDAITAHGGQATAAVTAFQALSPADQQGLLDFLGCI